MKIRETVYGDVLFVINFSMDFISLFITSKILHIRTKTYRLCISAALGGIYGVASLFFGGGVAVELPVSILVCGVMCAVGFGFNNTGRFALAITVFFASGSTLSGIMTAITSMLGKNASAAGNLSDEVSVRSFAVAALFAAVITFVFGRVYSARRRETTVDIKITSGKNSAECRALVDSGNMAREPISGRPAVIVRAADVEGLLPCDLNEVIKGGRIELDGLSFSTLKRTRLIPINSISGKKIMLSYSPDSIELKTKGKSRCVDAVIVIDTAENVNYGDAEAVVPASLLP